MKNALSAAIAEQRRVKLPEEKPQVNVEEIMAMLDPESKKQLLQLLTEETQGESAGDSAEAEAGLEDAQGSLKSTPGEKKALLEEDNVQGQMQSAIAGDDEEVQAPQGLAQRLKMKAQSLMKGKA